MRSILETGWRRFGRLLHTENKLGVSEVLLRDLLSAKSRSDAPLEEYIHAGYRWLCAAQDAGPDRGVAAYYSLFSGWGSSYPETTGYIIPTLLEYARRFGDEEARHRALEMADWECEVQLANGAVRRGTMEGPPVPAVFNTGQVLFGWAAAYEDARSDRHRASARRAAEWMIETQDEDGVWRKDTHPMNTYNARAAWGLALAGVVFGEIHWVEAACRKADWVLTQQNSNGWYANASWDAGDPYLHFFAYVIEGMLELGALVDRAEYVSCARRAADPLLEIYARDGHLGGRVDETWRASAGWHCLTGEAQLALSWLRLHELTGEGMYLEQARRLNRDVVRTVALDVALPAAVGGVKGSHPIWGEYGSLCYLNWATKFLLDSLLVELRLVGS
jgi:uncharacterized protein YyaL (SSP411 family)